MDARAALPVSAPAPVTRAVAIPTRPPNGCNDARSPRGAIDLRRAPSRPSSTSSTASPSSPCARLARWFTTGRDTRRGEGRAGGFVHHSTVTGAARPPSPRGEPAGRQQGCGPLLTGPPLTPTHPFGLFALERSHHVTNTYRRASITLCVNPGLIEGYIIHGSIVELACGGPNRSSASGIPLLRQRSQSAAWLIER